MFVCKKLYSTSHFKCQLNLMLKCSYEKCVFASLIFLLCFRDFQPRVSSFRSSAFLMSLINFAVCIRRQQNEFHLNNLAFNPQINLLWPFSTLIFNSVISLMKDVDKIHQLVKNLS